MKPMRSVAGPILIVVTASLFSAAVFAQPPVPHDVEEDGVSYEDCASCHRAGEDDAPRLAPDHVQHENADCRVCHGTTGMVDAPAISHPAAGWEDCRGCHERWENQEIVEIPDVSKSDYDHTPYESGTCLSCHPGDTSHYEDIPEVACGVCHPESARAETVHNGPDYWVDCVDCHRGAAHYPHDPELIRSTDEDCTSCHHEEEGHWSSDKAEVGYSLSAHIGRGDPHARVDCSACHLEVADISVDPTSNRVRVQLPETEEGIPPDDPQLANVILDVDCARCHATNSGVPVAAHQLPPRSVLCMSCHDASPVLKDGLSQAGVGVFGLGMVLVASVWLQGAVGGRRAPSIFKRIWHVVAGIGDLLTAPRVFIFIWSFFVDGLLHRELFRRDKIRWMTHTAMFWGMGARMALGVFTWLLTLTVPMAPLTQVLVDKSSPAVAVINDGLGALVVLGAAVAVVRRYITRDDQLITGGQDTVAIGLLGAIFLMGFVVEGARIESTDLSRDPAVYSFIGYALSRGLDLIPVQWTMIYGWLWYVHAGLVAALIAYLPFSKFMHVLIGPFVTAYNTAREARTA